MLDIELFRENPEKIKKSEKRRGKTTERVDKVVELDKKWRKTLQKEEELREKRNNVTDIVAEKKKKGESAEKEIKEMQEVKKEIKRLSDKQEELLEKRDELRYQVGNILHKSVPNGDGEEDNKEIKVWEPEEGKKEDGRLAADVLEEADLVDTEKGAEIAGERGYYLKNDLVKLNWALQQFAMDLLIEKGFTPVQTPYLMKKKYIEAAAELEDFHEQLYKMSRSDKYLIATSEQTLATYHYDEILQPEELPKKYAGFSTVFRREAGKHGKQTRGIWRVHQFEKIEQYIFAEPENSWEMHEELLANAEEVVQKLGLPYRVVNVCTGDMNDNAAKKYDIEVWRPPLEEYGEIVSCSNCTDYQARKVKTRIRRSDENEVVHSLNATACATQRVMTAIVENNQTEKGIKIPEVLQDYMGGQEYIKV